MIRTAHRLGIASRLEPNASIALGTSEVSPLELTGAYAPFANGGMAVMPACDREDHGRQRQAALCAQRATDRPRRRSALRGDDERHDGRRRSTIGTARKASLPGWPAAGKTGTIQDFRDAWFIGYTAHLVTGVWLGNDDGTPTKHVTGGSLPVEIWSRFMRAAHQGVPPENLPGDTSGGLFSGLFSGDAQRVSDNPTPPAPIESAAANAPRQTSGSGGLDDWLLNNLFGGATRR